MLGYCGMSPFKSSWGISLFFWWVLVIKKKGPGPCIIIIIPCWHIFSLCDPLKQLCRSLKLNAPQLICLHPFSGLAIVALSDCWHRTTLCHPGFDAQGQSQVQFQLKVHHTAGAVQHTLCMIKHMLTSAEQVIHCCCFLLFFSPPKGYEFPSWEKKKPHTTTISWPCSHMTCIIPWSWQQLMDRLTYMHNERKEMVVYWDYYQTHYLEFSVW